MTGTRSGGNSTPRSPRATMTPSLAATMRLEVLHGVRRLDLRDDRRRRAPRLADLADGVQVLGAPDEAHRDVVDAAGEPEREVALVLLGQGRDAHRLARQVHADVVAHPSALLHAHLHALALDAQDAQDEAPVVEEHVVAHPHVRREALVVDRDDPLVLRRLPLHEERLHAARRVELLRELPVRILGPQRSCSAATDFLRSSLASRSRASAPPWSSCDPCEKLRRATSMPASMSARRPSGESDAGPKRAHELRSPGYRHSGEAGYYFFLACLSRATLRASSSSAGCSWKTWYSGTARPRTSTTSTAWPRRRGISSRRSRGRLTSWRTPSRRTRRAPSSVRWRRRGAARTS